MKDQKIKIVIPYITESNIEIQIVDAFRLLDLITNTDIKLANCVGTCFNAELKINTFNTMYSPLISTQLALNGLAHIEKTKCMPPSYKHTSYDKARSCFYNLQCGKCKDEFVRRTVGTVLFPQHYAKDKQK